MSVGHLARLLEAAGIATVIVMIKAFAPRVSPMRLPRVLLTPFMLGRPIGPAFATDVQRETLRQALALLESADQPETVIELAK